jgi:DNA-binding NarL/FixJ family response regulator
VQGLSNKEIAQRLDCAENTVELHVTQLLRKAGASSRTKVVAQFWAL